MWDLSPRTKCLFAESLVKNLARGNRGFSFRDGHAVFASHLRLFSVAGIYSFIKEACNNFGLGEIGFYAGDRDIGAS